MAVCQRFSEFTSGEVEGLLISDQYCLGQYHGGVVGRRFDFDILSVFLLTQLGSRGIK